MVGRNGEGLALLLNRRGKERLLIFCYARRTRTSRGTIRLKGGAHKEMLRPCYEVLGFLVSQEVKTQRSRRSVLDDEVR
jgi:hypothetical protein